MTRYTMEAKNQTIGVVLRTLEVRAQLQIVVAEDAREQLLQLVSFDVKEATLEELLQATFRNSGLTFQLDGTNLHVRRAPP